MGRSDSDSEVQEAKGAILTTGPVPVILAAQEPGGYWVRPGPGYGPKYRSTVWSVIFLAQLGADGSDARVAAGCEYILSHSTAAHGGFAMNGTPSTFVHCLGGNLAAALTDLGWLDDERLRRPEQPGCPGTLLPADPWSALRLWFQRPLALRLGGSQGNAGLQQGPS